MTHGQRLDIHSVEPAAQQAVLAMERYVRGSGLEPRLYELVKIRASQINGDAGVPDPVWDDVAAQFDEAGIVHLLMAVATINVWNRLAVSTHQSLPDAAVAA
jgi:alkylhydroperoxidase family enzyme